MGTSGAYGGSTRQDWTSAHDQLADLPAGTDGAPGGPGGEEDRPVADLWSTIGDALVGEDPILDGPAPTEDAYPLPELLPRRPAGRGSGGGGGRGGAVRRGGPVRAETGSGGRRGSGSSRSIRRGAARGGAALGAAYALRQGDAPALADVGLDLDELRTLSPTRQCMRILDAVLGEGGHPDEHALRRATAAAIKEVLQSSQPPDEIDALRGLIENFVFQIALVELQSELTSGEVSPPDAARRESRMRRWIRRRVRLVQFPVQGRLPIARFREAAARLCQEAVRILRAGLQST
jgi:hypothetical protein